MVPGDSGAASKSFAMTASRLFFSYAVIVCCVSMFHTPTGCQQAGYWKAPRISSNSSHSSISSSIIPARLLLEHLLHPAVFCDTNQPSFQIIQRLYSLLPLPSG